MRKYFQFSFRSLLWPLLTLCIALAWLKDRSDLADQARHVPSLKAELAKEQETIRQLTDYVDNENQRFDELRSSLQRRWTEERNLTRYLENKIRKLEALTRQESLMKKLPLSDSAQVVRTDFSDDTAWREICEAIREPSEEGFEAYVEFVDDPAFAGLTKGQILALRPEGYHYTFVLVVDQVTIASPERPVLVIELWQDSGNSFRAVPSQIQAIENNLSIANMDFDEFAGAVDGDGVFRGFPE